MSKKPAITAMQRQLREQAATQEANYRIAAGVYGVTYERYLEIVANWRQIEEQWDAAASILRYRGNEMYEADSDRLLAAFKEFHAAFSTPRRKDGR